MRQPDAVVSDESGPIAYPTRIAAAAAARTFNRTDSRAQVGRFRPYQEAEVWRVVYYIDPKKVIGALIADAAYREADEARDAKARAAMAKAPDKQWLFAPPGALPTQGAVMPTMDDEGRCLICHHDHSVKTRDEYMGDYVVAAPGHDDYCNCMVVQIERP